MSKSQVRLGRSRQTSKPPAVNASHAPALHGRRAGGPGGTRADRVPPAIGDAEPDSRLLLRPAEVAKTLGISRSKVFELLSARELPSVHVGRSTRIPRAQLEEWIQAQVCWQPQMPSGLLGRLHASASARA
jgi:excisionase family DNA binding protein